MPYSVQDQITELSKKLALHEGDLKAYDEASKQEIQQNFDLKINMVSLKKIYAV